MIKIRELGLLDVRALNLALINYHLERVEIHCRGKKGASIIVQYCEHVLSGTPLPKIELRHALQLAAVTDFVIKSKYQDLFGTSRKYLPCERKREPIAHLPIRRGQGREPLDLFAYEHGFQYLKDGEVPPPSAKPLSRYVPHVSSSREC